MNTGRRRVASPLNVVLVALTAFLSLGVLPRGATEAQVSALPLNFSDVAIFATNSVRIDNGAQVTSGHVVVNNASTGPTLSPGVELGLGNNARTPTGYAIVADSISISNGVVVGGNAFFNTLSNSGTINGTQNTPLALPVFSPLPTFKSAPPGTLDVTVPNGTVQTLAAGNYRDIKVLQNATLRIDQGVTNVRSITVANGGKLLFLNLASGSSEVRVAEQMTIGNNFVVGPVDSDPLKAGKIIFYVASASLMPVAVDTGNGGTLYANVYAPNGTLILDNGTSAAGAFLAKNVDVQNGSHVALESFFTQQAPAITSANSTTFAPGLPGQTFLVTTTGAPTNTITRSGTLPSGVTFTDNGDNTATIAGTPAAGTQSASPYAWVIMASNGVPPNAMQNFTFNVVCPAITVSGTIPDLIVNQAMAPANFSQAGGSGTITWSATGLPNGTSINASSGSVTGTPTATGTYNVTITATDAGGCTGSKNLTVTVKQAPAITSANSTTFAPGVSGQTFTVTTTGFPTNTITRSGPLPSGVTFTDNGNNTATIAGTPAAGTQSGSPYAWVIMAANGAPPDATQNFTFNVVCPTITVSGTIPALVFNTAMTPVTFTQAGGNPPITWSATGLPTGTTINPGSGQVSGTPTVTGTFNVTVTATDVGACTGTKNQTVTVAPVATGDSYSGLVDNTQFVITGGTTASPSTPFVGATGKLTANDQPSGGVSATAGTFATSAGGSVTIANDGTFIYTPKANPGAAATTSDSFTYTVFSNTGGGGSATSAPATVNLTLAGRVWYVLNTAGGGGNGQSQSPFNLLSDGVAASTADDTIYVYQGDGTTTNLATASTLKPGQDFIGQGVALVVNGNTLVAAGGFPLIGNTVTLATNVIVNGIDMTTGGNSGIVGTSVTGLDVTVRNLTTTTGTALNLNASDGTVTVSSVTTSGGGAGATHIVLTNVNGTVALNGGALAGAGANTRAIDVNGGTANVTYAGTISNTGSANNGGGISVANKTGGTVTLSGTATTLSTGSNTAVNLSSNTGATTTFSGGGLGITTTSGTGFSATGGGTVSVQGTGNTINSSSGTALNIANTTIGASHVTFQSISSGTGSNSGPTGIILDTTGSSGGLHVTGTGTAGSGGTIQHKTGADGSVTTGVGIYLNNTTGPQFAWMQLNDFQNYGILGNNVAGFTLDRSTVNGTNGTLQTGLGEGSVYFTGLTGSATVSNSTLTGGVYDTFHVFNDGGQTLNRITITNSSFAMTNTSGNDAIVFQATGGTFNATVQSSMITAARGDLFQLNLLGTVSSDLVFGGATAALGNTLTNNNTNIVAGGGGVTIGGGGPSNNVTLTYNIAHNSMRGAAGAVLAIAKGTGPGGSFTGTIDNNVIGQSGVGGSGSTQGEGIAVFHDGAGTSNTTITNNQVYGVVGTRGAIDVFVHNDATGQMTAVVQGNTIGTLDQDNSFAGMYLQTGSNPGAGGDDNKSCLTIGGAGGLKNTIDLGANVNFAILAGIILEQEGVSRVGLLGSPNYSGGVYNDGDVQTFVENNNTVTNGNGAQAVFAFHDGAEPAGGGFFGTCPP